MQDGTSRASMVPIEPLLGKPELPPTEALLVDGHHAACVESVLYGFGWLLIFVNLALCVQRDVKASNAGKASNTATGSQGNYLWKSFFNCYVSDHLNGTDFNYYQSIVMLTFVGLCFALSAILRLWPRLELNNNQQISATIYRKDTAEHFCCFRGSCWLTTWTVCALFSLTIISPISMVAFAIVTDGSEARLINGRWREQPDQEHHPHSPYHGPLSMVAVLPLILFEACTAWSWCCKRTPLRQVGVDQNGDSYISRRCLLSNMATLPMLVGIALMLYGIYIKRTNEVQGRPWLSAGEMTSSVSLCICAIGRSVDRILSWWRGGF